MLPSARPGHLAWFVFLALSVLQLPAADPARKGVDLQKAADKLVITLNGELFTEYHFGPAPHVYFYPVIGPSGQPMTRNAPMKTVPGEDADHPHHRSIWFSHGDVNGIDFWAESPKSGKIVHDRFIKISPGEKEGSFRAAHKWIGPDGAVVCTDETYFRLLNTADHRLFDLEVTIKAPDGKELVLGDTKEGTMAIRLAETMRLKANKFNAGKPGGHIVQSTGARDNDTWGKRAEWCDYYGPVNDRTVGVAIFDHPSNPRHPTWWHVRDYGLFAANPFGVHDFEKKPAGTGALKVAAGKTVTFRYRFYLHPGDHEAAGVAAKYREWAGSAPRHVSLQP